MVICPWKTKPTPCAADTAQELQFPGADDHLGLANVSLPSVAQAGVLAWAAPGFDLKRIPFDHWLEHAPNCPSHLAAGKQP